MFVSVRKNLQNIDICTLRMSTSFEYIVDTSEKTESLLCFDIVLDLNLNFDIVWDETVLTLCI